MGQRSKLGNGQAEILFEQLVLIETDDHVLWPSFSDRNWYGQIAVGGRITHVHRLALERRKGPEPDLLALHGPGCPRRCMNYRHLRWGTRKENALDAVRDGVVRRGENHGGHKLTEAEVLAIRSSSGTQQSIAATYGVSRRLVGLIRSGQAWAWLHTEMSLTVRVPSNAEESSRH